VATLIPGGADECGVTHLAAALAWDPVMRPEARRGTPRFRRGRGWPARFPGDRWSRRAEALRLEASRAC